jgi:predicted transcriptional regulator
MHDLEQLCAAIPVGEENAEGASEIWKCYDLGARSSVQYLLNQLTGNGRIKRKPGPLPNGGEVHLYYRVSE